MVLRNEGNAFEECMVAERLNDASSLMESGKNYMSMLYRIYKLQVVYEELQIVEFSLKISLLNKRSETITNYRKGNQLKLFVDRSGDSIYLLICFYFRKISINKYE